MELETHLSAFHRQAEAEVYMSKHGIEQVHLDEIDEAVTAESMI